MDNNRYKSIVVTISGYKIELTAGDDLELVGRKSIIIIKFF